MEKKDKITILIRVLLITALISGSILLIYEYSIKRAKDNFNDLAKKYEKCQIFYEENNYEIEGKVEKEEVNIGLEKLYKENEEIVAWIKIPETEVNYPVMYSPDQPEYYLYRNFNKEYSLSGVPFIDGKASIEPDSDNILIHGHNMKNGSMFAQLLKYKDQEFLENHPTIELHRFDRKDEYDIFAVVPTDINKNTMKFDYHSFFNAENEEEFNKYISDAKKYSLYDREIPLEYGDKLITLSTCAYHIDNGRFVVVGKRR